MIDRLKNARARVRDRIVPLRADDYDAELLKPSAEGKVRLGSGEPLDDSFWDLPAPRISMKTVRRVIRRGAR